jgi:hypothetical protein
MAPINESLSRMTGGKICSGSEPDGLLRIFKKAILEDGSSELYARFGENALQQTAGNQEVVCFPFWLFITGDIAFYCMCQGKEDSTDYHCNWCTLSSKEWQLRDHIEGVAWIYDKLNETASRLTPETDRIRGVKSYPLVQLVGPDWYICHSLYDCHTT